MAEYADRDFTGGVNPNYGKPTGERRFSGYINGHSTSRAWRSLDHALAGIIAFKRDGINSQVGYLFMKATAPDDGGECDPEVRQTLLRHH